MEAIVNVIPDMDDRRIVRLMTARVSQVTVGVSGRDSEGEPSLAVEVTVGGPSGPVRLVTATDARDARDARDTRAIEAARRAEEEAALAAADHLALAEETNALRP